MARMTIEERERRAYANGDPEAGVLGIALDVIEEAGSENEDLKTDLQKAELDRDDAEYNLKLLKTKMRAVLDDFL